MAQGNNFEMHLFIYLLAFMFEFVLLYSTAFTKGLTITQITKKKQQQQQH